MLLAYQLSCLILALLAALFTAASWGRTTQYLLGISNGNAISSIDVWTGLVVLASFAEFAQLLLPLQWPLSLFCIGIALISGYTWQRHLYLGLWEKLKHYCHRHFLGALFFVIVFIFMCLGAMVPTGNYDSGLYHFGSIAWLNEYPIALGLGNLHSRLAFNQSYFELIALLNFAPLWNKGYAMIGPLLIGLTAFTFIEFRNSRPALPATIYIGCMIICAFLTYDLASPFPDLGIQTIQLVIFALAFVLLNQYHVTREINLTYLCTLLLLCGLMVFIKLSSVAFALGSILITAPLLKTSIGSTQGKRALLRVTALLILFGFIHALRSYLLSGAPLYPTSLAAAWDLPWSMSPLAIQKELDWAYSWARIPGASPDQVLGHWQWYLPWTPGNWVTPWIKALPFSGKLAFTIIGITLIAHLVFKRLTPLSRQSPQSYVLLIPLAAAVLFWFFTAPDLRFLGSIHWLIALLCIELLSHSLEIKPNALQATKHYSYILCLVSAGILAISIQIQKPGLFEGWSIRTPIKVISQKTESGNIIFTPAQGDQCVNAILPCTPYFNPHLTFEFYRDWWPIFIDTRNHQR